MIAADSVLSRLLADGLTVTQSGDSLLVGPRELLTSEHRTLIRENKAELLHQLAADARREALIRMLNDRPGTQRAFMVEPLPNGGGRVSLAVRGIGTCDLLIPQDCFDALAIANLFTEFAGYPA